jgi:hypothetical protein
MKKFNYYVQLVLIILMMVALPVLLVQEHLRPTLLFCCGIVSAIQCVNSIYEYAVSCSEAFKSKIKQYWHGLSITVLVSSIDCFIDDSLLIISLISSFTMCVYYLSIYKKVICYKREKALW